MIDALARLYVVRAAGGDWRPARWGGARLEGEGHMHNAPIDDGRPPVEAKVKWASLGGFLGSVGLLAILQVLDSDHSLIEWWPDWLEAVTIPLLPTAIAAVAGWKARHTPRPDLPADQR